jgi:predicted RNase H-like nuclease (RuvC/YqgF family)
MDDLTPKFTLGEKLEDADTSSDAPREPDAPRERPSFLPEPQNELDPNAFTPAPEIDTTERDVSRKYENLQRRLAQTQNANEESNARDERLGKNEPSDAQRASETQNKQNTERTQATATEQTKESVDQLKKSLDDLSSTQEGGGEYSSTLADINAKLDAIIAAQTATDAAIAAGWAGVMAAIVGLDNKIDNIETTTNMIDVFLQTGLGLG